MRSFIFTLLVSISTLGLAANDLPTAAELEAKLKRFLPDLVSIDAVNPTPFECLYEVIIDSTVFYSTADGEFIINGEILNLGKTTTSLTAQTHNKLRLQELEDHGQDYMIYFGPKDNDKTITVFSSVNCAHCQKFHGEISKLNKAGVTVRYLAFPINPPGTEGYETMAQVWNSDDRATAWGKAIMNKALDPKLSKDDAVLIPQMELAYSLQLSGTPSIIFNDGSITYGYLPAKTIVDQVESHVNEKNSSQQ